MILGFAKELIAAGLETPGTFYVATNGNDHWSGRSPSHLANSGEGPFATLPRALKAVRDFNSWRTSDPIQPVTVFIRGGTYYLDQPLILKPGDSNLLIAAYAGESPILSGGQRITSWHKTTLNGSELWVADVPDSRNGKWVFRELWLDGERAVSARLPAEGYFHVYGVPDKSKNVLDRQSRFQYRNSDLRAWNDLTNAEVVVMDRWLESRLPIAAIDEQNRWVSFSKRTIYPITLGDIYYVEGAMNFLTEPGEWYLNPMTGKVYYFPRLGEDLQKIIAIAPRLPQVLRFEGQPETGHFVQNVIVRGLTFANTEWNYPQSTNGNPKGTMAVGGFEQAEFGVPGGVGGVGMRQCAFDKCNFVNMGGYGLELSRGCQSNSVFQCEFHDLGAGGLKLGEGTIRKNPLDQTQGNEISHCRIHDGGFLFPSAVGIWLSQTSNNRITHNLIYNFYYTGISIGWSWGYGPALASNNYVGFNEVHHIGIKSDGEGPILSDMGAIYTLGKQPGTIICNNLLHDVAGLIYGGWGIYFDEGSSGILAVSNVVYRTTHGGFHQHYGETNVVLNNIFAFGRDHQLRRSVSESHISFYFQTNIVYFDTGDLLDHNWSDDDHFVMDGNVYFDARSGSSGEPLQFDTGTFEDWQKRGHDLNSIIANPQFVAPQNYDFRLKASSPALKIGFHPIDISQVGP